MVIHVGIEIKPGVEEHLESGQAVFMNGQPLRGDQRVMNQSGNIHRPDRDAAHVGVAQDVIEVVRREQPSD